MGASNLTGGWSMKLEYRNTWFRNREICHNIWLCDLIYVLCNGFLHSVVFLFKIEADSCISPPIEVLYLNLATLSVFNNFSFLLIFIFCVCSKSNRRPVFESTLHVARNAHGLPWSSTNAAVTCEIKLFWDIFEIISVFYFTCNHVWTEIKLLQPLKEF